MFDRIRAELSSFSSKERIFVLFCMLAGFFTASEYGITRPASNSLFLSHFSFQYFPYVWLAGLPLNLLVVYLYNRYLPRVGPWKLICSIALLAIGINSATGLFLKDYPALIFFQFAWKDIYILLMFKQLWSMIHSTISSERAKYLYGVIFAVGTLGSVLSSLIPGFFAAQIGSEQLFFFTLPLYALLLLSYRQAYTRSVLSAPSFKEQLTKAPLSELFRSPYLTAVLLVVVFMQVSVGLAEYRFNAFLEREILDKDLRTEYLGRLVSMMNFLSGALQLVGSFLMIQWLGVKRSHLAIPAFLLATAAVSLAFPSFALLSFGFVLIKGIDYSLFGVMREMLYVPMQMDQKFRTKAIIDVFAYRSSKALVSLSILSLQFFSHSSAVPYIASASIAIFFFWIAVVWFLLRKHYPQRQS